MDFFTPSLLKGAAVAAFLLVQLFVGIMAFVLRYHFRVFALPDDPLARNIVRVMTYGALVGFALAGMALYASIAVHD